MKYNLRYTIARRIAVQKRMAQERLDFHKGQLLQKKIDRYIGQHTPVVLSRPFLLRMTLARQRRLVRTISSQLKQIDKCETSPERRRLAKRVFQTVLKYPMFVYKHHKFRKTVFEKIEEFNNQGEVWIRDCAKQLFGPNWENLNIVEKYVKKGAYCYQVE